MDCRGYRAFDAQYLKGKLFLFSPSPFNFTCKPIQRPGKLCKILDPTPRDSDYSQEGSDTRLIYGDRESGDFGDTSLSDVHMSSIIAILVNFLFLFLRPRNRWLRCRGEIRGGGEVTDGGEARERRSERQTGGERRRKSEILT